MYQGEDAEENDGQENMLSEPAVPKDVMSNLLEPSAVSSEGVASGSPDESEDEHKSDSDASLQTPTKAVDSKDEPGKAIVMAFNNALQEVAEAYNSSTTACALEDKIRAQGPSGDVVDVDTTPSVSALSEGEEMATPKVKKGTPSETSDSDNGTVGSVQFGDFGHEDRSSATLRKCDTFTSSPTSWMARQSSRRVGSPGNCTAVDMARMTRALLNKLTEERFESLCSQILSLPLSTTEQLAVMVAEIFQKATTQDCFRALYTELCMRLDAHLAPQTSAVGGKAFRKALVSECQATFERSLQPPDASLFVDLNGDEQFELEMKLKTRRLGNMRFIGDLLVRKLLSPKLLPQIVHELLNRDEAALESLIALLTTVSPEFETRPSLYQAPLRDAFAVLKNKMSDKAVCSRVRCQINDLFDAKARGWTVRSTTA